MFTGARAWLKRALCSLHTREFGSCAGGRGCRRRWARGLRIWPPGEPSFWASLEGDSAARDPLLPGRPGLAGGDATFSASSRCSLWGLDALCAFLGDWPSLQYGARLSIALWST